MTDPSPDDFAWTFPDDPDAFDEVPTDGARRTLVKVIALLVVIAMIVALAIPVIVRIRRTPPPATEPGVLTHQSEQSRAYALDAKTPANLDVPAVRLTP